MSGEALEYFLRAFSLVSVQWIYTKSHLLGEFYSRKLIPIPNSFLIQNAAVRKIARVAPRESSGPLHEKIGILNLQRLYYQTLLSQLCVKNSDYGDALIEHNATSHTYLTRNADKIRIPPTRLSKTDRLYSNRFLRIYRNHKEKVDRIRNQPTYRKKKKQFLYSLILKK